MSIPTITEIAWLAGLLEGEGSFIYVVALIQRHEATQQRDQQR
jgi:hypothetical protein